MAGHVLLIDSDAPRRAALSAALRTGYLVTETCATVEHAVKAARASAPALILIEGDDGGAQSAALCVRLKSDVDLATTPVVVAVNADDRSGRVAVLEAGADDLLVRPIDTRVLLARIRSLARLRAMSDELMLRQATARDLGIAVDDRLAPISDEETPPPHVLIIGKDRGEAERLSETLGGGFRSRLTITSPGFGALRAVETDPPDAIMVLDTARPDAVDGFAEPDATDPVQFVGILRGRSEIRNTPILMLSSPEANPARIAAALDVGATDCASITDTTLELQARLGAQLRRKRYADQLRTMLDDGMRRAITDPLTELPGRRYLEPHLERLFTQARSEGRSLAVLLFDLDHFKLLNDQHGHNAGDEALRAFADRLRAGIRASDLAVRYGGEEFLVLAPDTGADAAAAQAARICQALARDDLALGSNGASVSLTVSAGVAAICDSDTAPSDLIARADAALGAAKANGRNQVRIAAA